MTACECYQYLLQKKHLLHLLALTFLLYSNLFRSREEKKTKPKNKSILLLFAWRLLWLLAVCSCGTHKHCGRISSPQYSITNSHTWLKCSLNFSNIWWTGWSKWVNRRVKQWPKDTVGKLVFSHPLKPVFSCTYTWNKSAHSLEQTL